MLTLESNRMDAGKTLRRPRQADDSAVCSGFIANRCVSRVIGLPVSSRPVVSWWTDGFSQFFLLFRVRARPVYLFTDIHSE